MLAQTVHRQTAAHTGLPLVNVVHYVYRNYSQSVAHCSDFKGCFYQKPFNMRYESMSAIKRILFFGQRLSGEVAKFYTIQTFALFIKSFNLSIFQLLNTQNH